MPISPTSVRVETCCDFALEDLPLRGQDLDVELVLGGHVGSYAAAAALAFSVTWSIEPFM